MANTFSNISLTVHGFMMPREGESLEYFSFKTNVASDDIAKIQTDKKSVALKDTSELNELIYSINPAGKKMMGHNPTDITCYVIGCLANNHSRELQIGRLHQLISQTGYSPDEIQDPLILVSIGETSAGFSDKINNLFCQHLVKADSTAEDSIVLFQQALTDITKNTANTIQQTLKELALSKNEKDEDSKVKCFRQKFVFIQNSNKFNNQLEELSKKAKEHESNGQKDAAKEALELHKSLHDLSVGYFSNPRPEKYNTFKKEALKAIEKAEPVLSTHRSFWKVILANITLAILGLGVFYGAAVAINKNFFFMETQSKKKLNNVEKMLKDDELAQTPLDANMFKL